MKMAAAVFRVAIFRADAGRWLANGFIARANPNENPSRLLTH
jgi:hypothetical protein